MTALVPEHPRRLTYLGTPEVAVPPLRALVDAGFDLALVVTRADKRRGRRGAPEPTPVKAAAIELGIPVTHAVDDVLDAGADLGVVVAFGRLIKPHILRELAMVNLHFSLLPRWRGAAPVERAVLAGDEVTGVCVMDVDESLDTGAVYRRAEVPILPDQSAEALRDQLVEVGGHLLVDALRDGLRDPVPQEGVPTYAEKIEPADLELRWDRPAVELYRLVRVGGAWTTFRGRRFKLSQVRVVSDGPGVGCIDGTTVGTGDGGIELVEVQPEGKPVMSASAWANGAHADGETLGG